MLIKILYSTIKFKPDYVNSSTRYIILVAGKDDQSKEETFKNAWYIIDLLNRKTKGVLVDKIYSIGDEEIINAEVDISSILTENNHYIVNIISQELRFEKKINFYTPTTITHAGKEPTPTSDDDDGGEDKDKDKGESNPDGDTNTTTLVLAITIPIVYILIIFGIILFLRHKRNSAMNSREEIEKLTSSELIWCLTLKFI